MIKRLLIAKALTIPLVAYSAPSWAKNSVTKLHGNMLKEKCSGSGPSYDIAKRIALDNCLVSATHFLKKEVRVKSLSVETEQAVGYHQEVAADQVYKDLRCDPLKEDATQKEDVHTVWLLCKFDLAKVGIASAPKNVEEKDDGFVLNKKELNAAQSSDIRALANRIESKEKAILSVSSVPRCDSIMVRGHQPRVLKCSDNPSQVIVLEGDTEALVRKSGYQPKTIKLDTDRIKQENVTVILNRLSLGGEH